MNYEQKYLKYKEKYISLKNQLGGKIARRARYEYEVYKYCNKKLKELLERNGYIKVYILNMLHQIVIYFLNEIIITDKIDDFKKLYNDKTKNPLSGAIDIDLLEKKLKNENVENVVKNNFNIRSCLTFLDMISKYVSSRSASFTKTANFFDENIRLRDARSSVDSQFERDELCLNKFKIPSEHNIEKKLNHECLPMTELIEPYNELEKSKYSDEKLINFNVGRNIFTAPHLYNTVDVFSAGLSGHTIDISLLFSTFIFNNIKQEDIFVIVLSCLIWMLPYYHHSLREILGIGFIFLNNKNDDTYDDDYKKLINLFKIKKNNNLDTQIFDEIFQMIENKISVLNGKQYVADYPKTNDGTLFHSLLLGNNEKLMINRLNVIDTKGKMIKFLHLLNGLKDNKDIYIEIPL
jgi:hypothetical protein